MTDSDHPYTIETQRVRLLDAAVSRAPFDGWNAKLLANAAKDIDMPKVLAGSLFSQWPVDGIALHSALADDSMVSALQQQQGYGSWGVRETLKRAIMTRLKMVGGDKEAVRVATFKLSLPHYVYRANKINWCTVDSLWSLVGEDSGFDHYSKRSILAVVYPTILLHWFHDNSPDMAVTEAFIARQLDRVVAVMKPASQVRRRITDYLHPFAT